MILALMSLQQWMSAHALIGETGLNHEEMLGALHKLRHTQVKVLLLATEEDNPENFIRVANVYTGISNLDVGECVPDAPLFITQIAEDTEEAYVAAVRRVYPCIAAGEAPRAIVSFTSLLQQIPEYTHFSFHNPGLDARHYHAWVDSYLPIHPKQHTIAMVLGEIVQQKHEKAVAALLAFAIKSDPSFAAADLVPQAIDLLKEHETAPSGYIYRLKMRFMEETVFDREMVACIQERLGVVLTVSEFNQIWQTAHPDFRQIESKLNQVNAQAIRQARYDFELVSFTNPKDISHLLHELQRFDQDYVVVNGDLVGFAGLRLSCSYIQQKSIVEMLAGLIASESYPESFLVAQTPQKSSVSHNLYFVSSRVASDPELDAIAALPGVTLLLGWDGSPVQDWVDEQTKEAFSLERQFSVGTIS